MSRIDVEFYKVLALPAEPVADSFYFVLDADLEVAEGYLTDDSGVAFPLSNAEGVLALLTWANIAGKPSLYTTTEVDALLADYATLASPALSGNPTAPTQTVGNNSTRLANTAFVTAAVAAALVGTLKLQGNLDCSSNPNYPAGAKGDQYYVTAAGKIGGASGKDVEVGDVVICKADNAGGTEAAVGSDWFQLEHNLAGCLLASNNLADLTDPTAALENLGILTAGLDVITASDYATMRSLLDLVVGTNVQAHDTDLDAIAALDSSTAGVIASDGSGWFRKTYAAVKTALGLAKGDVGLGNVDNTADANKPVSTAQAAADAAILASAQSYADGLVIGLLDDRGNYNASGNAFPSAGGSGSGGAIKKGDLWTISVAGTLGTTPVAVGDTVRALVDSPGTTASNWAITEHDFGYTAENASNKDTSGGYAGLTLLKINFWNALGTFKSFFTNANTAARTYTFQDRDGTIADDTDLAGKVPTSRTVAGHALSADVTLVKGDVGLGNVDNTADASKPVSTAQQAALDLKAPLADAALTGNPTAPTQTAGNNTTRLANTAFVTTAIANLVNGAPGILDTLGEIATALAADESTASALATTVAGKLTASNNLSDIANAGTARSNLGLVIGTNVQAHDAELDALAGLTSAADKFPYFTGSGTASLLTIVAAIRSLLASADVATFKSGLSLAKSDVGLGNVDNTSDSTKNAATATLTNKRITRRVQNLSANAAAPAINTDNCDVVHITGQSVAIDLNTNLTGTPADGDTLRISITGTTDIAITHGSHFESSTVTLPTTTTGTDRLDIGYIWNSETSKWRCVAAA